MKNKLPTTISRIATLVIIIVFYVLAMVITKFLTGETFYAILIVVAMYIYDLSTEHVSIFAEKVTTWIAKTITMS